MLLKSLEIQGFKSFPDKTEILFTDGITAIVGPNGSGKSNIADAVRWVLGEMSSKTLRGVKMEDVIFDGTQDRKPLGFAEVSLTIDNSDGELPLEYNEITVTRRYYRSGESEYFINRAPVRLKDINELFMDTGLGKDGYSIIGQGRIAEILSVKSEDRRQIFEEAAGISKFRYRKAETERKLQATEENLLRLRDILTELEDRVEPLRIQSEKAQKYLILRDERRILEISVWLDNIEKIKQGIEKLEADCKNAKNLLADSETKLEAIERQIDKSYEATRQITVEIDNIRNEIHQIEEKSINLSSDIAILKNDILHNNEGIARIEEEINQQGQQEQQIKLQIEDKKTQIEKLENEKVNLEAQLNTVIAESTKLESASKEQAAVIEEKSQQAMALSTKLTDIKIAESSATANFEASNKRLNELDDEKANKQESLKALLDKKKETTDAITQKENKQKSLSNIINGYSLKLKSRQEKAVSMQKSYDALNVEFMTANQKIKMLTDMQRHFEGFSGSVKAVMEEYSRGGLKGIYGTVSSVINVSDENSLAIETALGAAIQNIVVDTENDAKAAIYFLKSKKAGRATFLPLSSVNSSSVNEKDFEKFEGFIGIGAKLVEFDSKFSGVVNSLLGRTIVVDHIDNAIRMAKATGYKYRIVTSDGQQVNAGGSLTGGSSVKNAGILTRANEIGRLKASVEELEQKLDTQAQSLKDIQAEVASLTASLDGANAENRVLDDELILERSELSHIEGLAADLQNELDNFENDRKKLEEDTENLKKQGLQLRTEIAELETQEAKIQEALAQLTAGTNDIAAQREQLNSGISQKRLEILNVSKDIEANKEAIIELNNTLELQGKSNEARYAQIEQIKQNNEQLNNQIIELEKQGVTFAGEIKAKKEQTQLLIKQREDAEKQITVEREREKAEAEIKSKYVAEVERLEGKKANVQMECDGIILKLWDEYELTVSDAQPFRQELESVPKANKRISDIKSEMKKMGDVNLNAVEEYKTVKERYDLLTAQISDIDTAKNELLKIITELTSKMREIFTEQFKVINENFNQTFIELFGGGTAKLTLSDPTDVLTSGIEINVAPPGKIIKHLSALSGGEQAFVAIALYFAILRVRPTPFCLLDEIEAALDDVNVNRYAEYLRRLTNKTQFITITHRRGTMEEADRLYGVTMQEKGVSKLLTINVNEMVEKLNLN
ncbi:MAG: chromosome segregation protein SMC [Ruminococcaceae bacterium]|nr:chromosome segregation protein SMC [Oscillospiraceae bacterium]